VVQGLRQDFRRKRPKNPSKAELIYQSTGATFVKAARRLNIDQVILMPGGGQLFLPRLTWLETEIRVFYEQNGSALSPDISGL
jgi:hypothetical protein